jgi:signal peptide peptidase SppA
MPTSLAAVPHLDQWFGLWAMEEARFWSAYEFLRRLDLHLHLSSGAVQAAQQQAATSGKLFEQRDGIALIGIHGRMMKQASSLSDGTSTVLARRQIRAAAADADVKAILLHIDSPGGTAAGTADLAADVSVAGNQKPVWSFVEDLDASAAYWVASQSQRVSANATALVGSIGTYGVVYDMSGAAAMEGVKAFVVRAGKFKGMGTPGTEVTQEQLAEMQRTVDGLNEHFLAGVAGGRKLSATRSASWPTGGCISPRRPNACSLSMPWNLLTKPLPGSKRSPVPGENP